MIDLCINCTENPIRYKTYSLCQSCYSKLIAYPKKKQRESISDRPVRNTPCEHHPEVLVSDTKFCPKCYAVEYERRNLEGLREYRKRYADRNREKLSEYSRHASRRRKFGISKEESDVLLKAQEGLCAICKAEVDGRNQHLDHCHVTGKIREFLCQKCNQALGMFKDRVDLLRAAIEYLEKHK